MDIPRLISRTKSIYTKQDQNWRIAEIKRLQEDIQSEIENSLRVSAHKLESICSHYSILAFHLIEQNIDIENAKSYLDLAFMYFETYLEQEYLVDKQKISMQFEEIRRILFRLAPMLLWAVLLENKNLAIKIKKQMDFYLNFKDVKTVLSLEYEFYCIWVFVQWNEIEEEILIKNDFLELVSLWRYDVKTLKPILLKICDFHCVEIVDNMRKKFLPRFTHSPFDLLPLEIHAFNFLRKKYQLEEVDIDHPLLNTQIAQIKNFEIIEDNFLEFVQIHMY